MGGVLILIPAAGASRRMGERDKLLERVAGDSLLRRQVRAATASGRPVLVTLPRHAGGPRAEQLEGLAGFHVAYIDASEGIAASLRTGAEAAQKADAGGLMVMLPDMPEIETADVALLLATFAEAPDTCIRATATDGTPGHPVVFPARLFPALAGLSGDIGGRTILDHESVYPVALDGHRATTDLDTPGAWAAWRAAKGL